jgi:hypothetical protein
MHAMTVGTLRRSSLYMSGIICLTRQPPTLLVNEPCHEVGEPQEIAHAKQRAALAEDDLRIWDDDVRPLPRHRADTVFVDPQQQPRSVSVGALAGADELPSVERMEWVRHADKAHARVRRACSSC